MIWIYGGRLILLGLYSRSQIHLPNQLMISIPSYPLQQLSELLSSTLLKETHQPQTEIDIKYEHGESNSDYEGENLASLPLDDARMFYGHVVANGFCQRM